MLARNRREKNTSERAGTTVKSMKSRSAVRASASSHLPGTNALTDMLYYLKLTREIEDRIERKLYRQGKIVGGRVRRPWPGSHYRGLVHRPGRKPTWFRCPTEIWRPF